MNHTNIAVAIIGAGRMAAEHARAFKDIDGVCVAGVASRTRSRAEVFAREFGIPQVFDTVDALYDQTHAPIVIVTVTETSIFEITLQCLKYPWLIFIEKPPGLELREAEQLAALAREYRKDLRVAMNRQSYSVTRELRRELLTQNEPRFIHVQDQEDPAAALRAGKPQRSVERWMFANSIHLVDYFRLLARGTAERVNVLQPYRPSKPCMVLARIEFSSGDVGLYQAAWGSPGPWAVSVTIPGQRWELRPLEQGTSQKLGERPVALPVDPWDHKFKPGFRYQAEQIVRLAMGGPCDVPTIEEVLPTMKLIDALYTV